MKTKKIIGIVAVFLLVCSAIIYKSSAVAPPEPHGPLVIVQKSSSKSITVGNIYTKAQVIALFGTPDEYNEWPADFEGVVFRCIYGDNEFYFSPERGLERFLLESNDFHIQDLPISIGDEYESFIATWKFLRMESVAGYETGVRSLQLWPEGYEDSYLSLYFRLSGDKYKLFRIAYSAPV